MTTFEQFFEENPEQRVLYEKEYNEFLLSEFILEKMEEEHISVRELARKADVSPTVIQKMRNSKTAENINYRTLVSVLNSLGYSLSFQKR